MLYSLHVLYWNLNKLSSVALELPLQSSRFITKDFGNCFDPTGQ